jgi:hypothetical protein
MGLSKPPEELSNGHSGLYNLLWNKSIWDGYFDQSKKPIEVARSIPGHSSPAPAPLGCSGAARRVVGVLRTTSIAGDR